MQTIKVFVVLLFFLILIQTTISNPIVPKLINEIQISDTTWKIEYKEGYTSKVFIGTVN